MAAGREGVARAEEKMMARLQSEVLIEATQTIRLNQILEAKVFDLEKRLRWSEEERLRDQRYSAAREEDVILLKDECRIMKSMTMNHLSVSAPSTWRVRGSGFWVHGFGLAGALQRHLSPVAATV